MTRRIVRQAYREIGALPLAASSSRRPRLVRARWASVGLAAGILVAAVGAARFADWRDLRLARLAATPPAAEPQAEPSPVEAPAAETAPVDSPPAHDAGTAAVAEAAADVPAAEPTPAPAATPPPIAEAVAAPAPAPAEESSPPAVDAAARLAAVTAAASARAAANALFAAWHVRPLDVHEAPVPAGFAAAAQQRGLEYLPLVGNLSMLRLLDLPAILELRIAGTEGTRYATLVGMTPGGALLDVGGDAVPIDMAFLDRHWFGTAYLVWRDFEALGRAFGREGRGTPVARLQALLRNVGAYRGPVTGVFDVATETAVIGFQRSRLLEPDGRVGRLTRIVLYAATGGYARPTLGAPS